MGEVEPPDEPETVRRPRRPHCVIIDVPGGWIYRFVDGMTVYVPDPEAWKKKPLSKATNIVLEIPTVYNSKGSIMPNYELKNDDTVVVSIHTTDSSGNTEPAPDGDTFSVTCDNPGALNVSVVTDASGGPAISMVPLTKNATNITVTVSDSSGLAAATQMVDVVSDTTPTNIVLDLVDAVHSPQSVPTN